ncbi:MAG: helix-turn-helix transcriptional regulator [Gammaproteobacteria bacterium]|jgi:DNA-binding Xre family transcriptional regulator
MLRFKLKDLIGRREFEQGRRITIAEVAQASGIHRMTLSKMINQRGYNTGTDNLDRLCAYFDCAVSDLVEYIPNETGSQPEA